MHTYAELEEYLSKGRDKNSRPWPSGKHTQIHRLDSGEIAVKLHDTDVMVIRPDNSRVLNSGGWKTVTTKERINEFMPTYTRIQTDKGVWNVYHHPYNVKLFVDGMVIGPDGKTEFPEGSFPLRNEASVRRQVARYTTEYVQEVLRNPYIYNTSQVTPPTPEEHREAVANWQLVPSILASAVRMYPVSQAVQKEFWSDNPPSDFLLNLALRQITSSVKRYLYHIHGLVM